MLYDVVPEPGELDPAELRAQYEAELRDVIAEIGAEAAAERTALDLKTVEALAAGESPTVTLEEAAALLALAEGNPDADTIANLAREELLMGMSTAVLDVDAVESGLGGEMEAREVQRKVEGRAPVTLAEFARLHQFIESRKR